MDYQAIINKGLALGIEELEIYVQETEGNTLKLFNGSLEAFNSKNILGVSIRGLYQGKMGYVYTESLEEADMDELLQKLLVNTQSLTATEKEMIYDGSGEYQVVEDEKADYQNYDVSEKVALLKELEAGALAKDKRIDKIGYCQYSENSSVTKIMNSKGLSKERSVSYISVFIGALATNGEQTAMGYAGDTNKLFKEIEKARIIDEATTTALAALGAGAVQTGKYPVVFKRDVATEILSAFSSIFCGEPAMKKMSILTEKIGTPVFGKNITIYDDPFYNDAIFKIPFDDEGVPCYTKTVVEDGVFKGFLHSQKTAAFFNTKSTGNGFKMSAGGSVTTGLTNLYLQPGTMSKEAIFATVENGIYVTEVAGLHAGLNPISGAFNVQATGYMIEQGKVTRPVTLFVVSGNFFELMNDISCIGNDIEKRFIGVAAPTIKVNSLMISGK